MVTQLSTLRRFGRLVLAVALTSAPTLAGPGGQAGITAGGESMLKRALGPEAAPAAPGGGRELFEAVLASAAFRSGSVGLFDVHVLVGSGSAAGREAEKLRDQVLVTLDPASALVSKLWPADGEGLVSATRFPVVIASNRTDYLQLVALLDHCERSGYSGWAPANQLDTPEARAAEVARTWEVQVFDLSHAIIAGHRAAWLKHGVGYYSLAFVANRALRKGAWGLVPPWLSSGLTDELDIEAYGQAWVGQDSWVSQTPGWYRSGWSGFVPEGSRPPDPVVGPPADLAVTVKKTGDAWLDYEASRTRHWSELLADLTTEAPASFARAAEAESFLPRDRAAARCLLHLMLARADGGPGLTALLDHPANTAANGMPDSDALPAIFARALGGLPEIDRLEALDARTLLTELGRHDLIERLEQVQAGAALALSDHRKQSAWLYAHECDSATRNMLFQSFLEIEYLQQMAEWKALGPHLDSGLRTALKACKAYPSRDRDLAAVAQAFQAGLVQRADDTPAAASGKKTPVRSKRK
jgi:hypothetical protein